MELYRSRPDATIDSVAADLGISSRTLRNWVRAAGGGKPRGRRPVAAPAVSVPLASLGSENAALRRKVRELEEERDILADLADWDTYYYTALDEETREDLAELYADSFGI